MSECTHLVCVVKVSNLNLAGGTRDGSVDEKKKIVDNLVNEIRRGKVLRRLSLKRKTNMAITAMETSHL